MMPARVALALQADGWYLRSDIIWHKPNPMPESVTDRPTKAHEYIFLLTKAERYFYHAEAIREPNTIDDDRIIQIIAQQKRKRLETNGYPKGSLVNDCATWSGDAEYKAGRNKRTVWTIATQPYAEAHFATFPEEIPKLCILAGSKLGDTVLDPFAGSGTTGKVALELGRKAILIELNPAYIELVQDRTFVTPGFL
jgi:DNA modification methylase